MSEDEIIQMAVECGIIPWTKHEYIGNKRFTATDDGLDGDAASLVQFFQMAVAHEREACAKIADEWAVGWPHPSTAIAERIRARGNK
jgi:hypothetical protein